MIKKLKTRVWDAAENLKTVENMAAYLEAAFEDGDAALCRATLGDIARANGITQIARDTRLSRENVYKALSPDGNPQFATILKVINVLLLKLHTSTTTV